MKHIDRTGQTFNWLTVIEDKGGRPNPRLLCRCKCGKTTTPFKASVVNGRTKSCGCRKKLREHGHTGTRLWGRWHTLKTQGRLDTRWSVFADMLAIVRDTNVTVVGVEKSKPIGPDNYRIQKELGQAKPLAVSGVTLSITAWSYVLSISKQRAYQLYTCGNLRRRILEVFGELPVKPNPRAWNDHTGKLFGWLTVIEDKPGQGARPKVVCRCDCGKTVTRCKHGVTSGSTKSCGCRNKKRGRKRKKRYIRSVRRIESK